jgi:NitT/TauT family transport system substrate-binding protein
MMTRTRTIAGLAASAATVALVAADCSGGGDDDGQGRESNSDGLDVVRVGVIPGAAGVPLYLGEEQGFFEEAGIQIEYVESNGGAAMIPGTISGDLDFAVANAMSVLIGYSTGLPLVVIGPANYSTGDPDSDFSAILVPEGSDIESAADLEGRTVAVNALNNIGDLSVRAAVEADGGDQELIDFVELPFPEMAQSLENGDVDAVWAVEPFVTDNEQHGAHIISTPLTVMSDSTANSVVATSSDLMSSDPDLVERFAEASTRSNNYAYEHQDEFREVLLEHSEIAPEVAEAMVLPDWSVTETTPEDFQVLLDYSQRYGIIEGEVDVNGLFAE